jgi:deoxyribodipyrimidine photolyase-like uncharacterized protein
MFQDQMTWADHMSWHKSLLKYSIKTSFLDPVPVVKQHLTAALATREI